MEISLIIGITALVVAIVVVGVSIAAIYYSLAPKSSSALGNISVGSITSSGNISTTQTTTASGNLSTTGLLNAPQINAIGTITTTGASTLTGNTFTTSQLNVTNTTDAISPTTGSIILTGGLGTLLDTYTNESAVFATSGGTASPLNWYEEYSANLQLSGIWASAQAWNVSIVRAGKTVTFQWGQATAATTTASLPISVLNIPTRFLDNASGPLLYVICTVINNGTTQTSGIQINTTNGTCIVQASPALPASFTTGGTGGILPGSAQWSL